MENTSKSRLIFSNFALKIIAIICMTFDHIGAAMDAFNVLPDLVLPLRIVGRLALPLFCFLIVEGVLHTQNIKKYFLRLGIFTGLIALVLIALEYWIPLDGISFRNEGNIFMDLLLGAFAVYLLNHKKTWVKFLALIPLGLTIGSSLANNFECVSCGSEVWIIPFFLRTQYNFYGLLMILGFYLATIVGKMYIKNTNNGAYANTKYERVAKNIFSLLFLIILNIVFYFIFIGIEDLALINNIDVDLQLATIFGGVLILFYNEKRGFNAYWFKIGCYLYYPIHIAVIYMLFALLH